MDLRSKPTAGYGAIAVTAALQLPIVWYAPEFDQTSLISVNTLNNDGIEVRFLPNKAVIGLRGSIQLFTGYEQMDYEGSTN